jgi:hypothetical protein
MVDEEIVEVDAKTKVEQNQQDALFGMQFAASQGSSVAGEATGQTVPSPEMPGGRTIVAAPGAVAGPQGALTGRPSQSGEQPDTMYFNFKRGEAEPDRAGGSRPHTQDDVAAPVRAAAQESSPRESSAISTGRSAPVAMEPSSGGNTVWIVSVAVGVIAAVVGAMLLL